MNASATVDTTGLKIAFVGGGNMATALIAGLAGKLTAAADIHVVDPNTEALARLRRDYGVDTAPLIGGALAACDVIVLAVKPQSLREAAGQLLHVLQASSPHAPLIVSIAAGVGAADLSRWLGGYAAIVRCMPNTPALVGEGITGMVAATAVSAEQRDVADAIMQAVGATVWLEDEALIDSVTAVSGSGPAYVFYFMEAMQEAAVELGLTAEQGRALTLATFVGAARLAAASDDPVSLLRERVTSKNGTTHAALTSMEHSGVKAAIKTAVKAAAARGREMGAEFGAA